MPEKEELRPNRASVGIIVGRFQVPSLHEGHRGIIEEVLEKHEKVVIILGVAPIKATKNNPLDFKARQKMIETAFPDVDVVYVKDNPDDHAWAKDLDTIIEQACPPMKPITLYGSRDSFIDSYKKAGGRFNTKELIPKFIVSGSQERDLASLKVKETEDFRRGVAWACGNQYPTAYPTVDVAIVRKEDGVITHLLMGNKKIDGDKIRFIGGFVDPRPVPKEYANGRVLEYNARREALEETGCEVDNFKYLGTFLINDWRYRNEEDKIVTTLFLGELMFGAVKASDDIDSLEWIEYKNLSNTLDRVVDIHKGLFKAVHEEIERNTKKAKREFAGNK